MRLIDTNALILNVEAAKNNNEMGTVVADTLLRYIEKCRTMAVVFCKDCEYWERKHPIDRYGYCKQAMYDCAAYHFCGWGVSKEKTE